MGQVKWHEMSERQKAQLLEHYEDMLEQLDLATTEMGAGMTYGRCVFPTYYRRTITESTEEQRT